MYEYVENGKTYYLIFLDGEIKQSGFETKEEAWEEFKRYYTDPEYFNK